MLRADGTLWLNLGDTYCGGGRGCEGKGWEQGEKKAKIMLLEIPSGLKAKDLIGIPWRVAFALQADGWYLRQDIIWHKPNPMPESVRDRCAKAHEYVFLLSKNARYYYDAEAIKEPCKDFEDDLRRICQQNWGNKSAPDAKRSGLRPRSWKGSEFDVGKTGEHEMGRAQSATSRQQRKPAGWDTAKRAHGSFHKNGRAPEVEYTETEAQNRNRRSVWTIATQPFAGAHFATFPPDLIKPMILAGCPEGGTVLDPFAGSGTTGMVAENLGRNSILIELNPKYIELIKERTKQMGLMNAYQG